MQAKDTSKQDPGVNIWTHRDENGERRLHKEELHSLYHSPDTIRVIKSRSLRWVCDVARMEEGRCSKF